MLMASPMKSYAIKVLDENDKPVAELMTANPSEILVYIHRGFRVIDKTSGSELTEDMVNSSIGVSDGFIDVNG